MITFLTCLALLVAAYFTYGRYLERLVGIDPAAQTPCSRLYDGVDYVPLPRWRIFLIQLLNIAGLGPIFGAVLGAAYGPVAFLWITLGGIFMGAMHDFIAGVISLRQDGASLPEIAGRYLGNGVKIGMRIFSAGLMVLVGAVFLSQPASLIAYRIDAPSLDVIAFGDFSWLLLIILGIILIYYIAATLLPVDKIIGRIYPIFGAILLFSAVGVFIGLFVQGYPLTEIWEDWNGGLVAYGDYFSANHFIPIFFITVACGILSGFHSTQTAIISRTMKSEKEGRTTFYNMMVLEGFIAMVWAAGAMGVYNLGLQAADASLATGTIGVVCRNILGPVGGVIAIAGVIVLPITSGDTALRALRMTVADAFHIDQTKVRKRLGLSAVIFALVLVILVFAKLNANGFNILWRYFAWSNQTLSLFAFLAISVWMFETGRGKYVWMPLIPGAWYTFVTMTYILNAQIGFHVPWPIAYVLGVLLAAAYVAAILWYGRMRARMKANKKDKEK